MKVIEEKDVQDGFTRRITYHIPYSTQQVDRMEYIGPKQAAYCGHSKKGHLTDEDFTEYESVHNLPEGKFICGECMEQFSNQGEGEQYQKFVDGELDDPRLIKADSDESD
jgi:hypothetical protein